MTLFKKIIGLTIRPQTDALKMRIGGIGKERSIFLAVCPPRLDKPQQDAVLGTKMDEESFGIAIADQFAGIGSLKGTFQELPEIRPERHIAPDQRVGLRQGDILRA